MSAPLHVYLIAGEPSGDILGMRLMTAIRASSTSENISFSGVGGPLMEGEGLTSLFPHERLNRHGLNRSPAAHSKDLWTYSPNSCRYPGKETRCHCHD